jgi:hypothetical protein
MFPEFFSSITPHKLYTLNPKPLPEFLFTITPKPCQRQATGVHEKLKMKSRNEYGAIAHGDANPQAQLCVCVCGKGE